MFSCNHNLTTEEVRRYSRQLIVEEIGVAGQEKLLYSSLLIVGAGGLGCPVALYSAAAGIGRIGIVDGDHISIDNLHRQIAHSENDLGNSKVSSLLASINQLNSKVKVEIFDTHLTVKNAVKILNNYDVIADCTDNVPTRYLINDICVLLKKPLVSGSALRWEGQLSVYNFGQDCPCFRCIFPRPPPAIAVSRCADSGVIGPIVGIVGNLQAVEIIKICALNISSFAGRIYLFNGLTGITKNVRLRNRQANCAVCSANNDKNFLGDYEMFCDSPINDNPISLDLLATDDRLTAGEFYSMCISDSPCLIDIRSSNQFDIGHISIAKNIEFSNLIKMTRSNLLSFLDFDENRLKSVGVLVLVYVICRRGNHSQLAVLNLREKFADIDPLRFKDIIGGYESWATLVDPSFPVY
ncbi:unnamed protein product [Dracunculus medinensis]|uniref:Adenylyltransferase and sulfurtransferase MOCS3 homolog n=1 Tax=Dracunculus medinensis TaxID=318479 RepID=A0A0N4U3I7_DRAME|nr:unnamed protein product [Dracunculus medinensis]